MAKELFDLFSKEMKASGYIVKEVIHPIFHPKNLQEMSKMGVSQSDVEDMLVFSIQNWEQLKKLPGMKGLAQEPCFNQMLSQWRYPTLIYISKTGIETAVEGPSGKETEEEACEWAKNKIVL